MGFLKKNWLWLGLLALVSLLALLVSWKSGIAGRIYRRLFPGPIPGEIQANQAQGMNEARLGEASPDGFDFIVAGHIYGRHEAGDHRPDGALLSAIPAILELEPDFLVSLGDTIQYGTVEDFDLLDQLFLSQLPFPVFNTVGNHDVADRALYEQRYGATFYAFDYGPARLIFLDTEIEMCGIDVPQKLMVRRSLEKALGDEDVRYIFIFMHKTLFFNNEVLAAHRTSPAGPNEWTCYLEPPWGELRESILPAAAQKPVYLFAGDVGVDGNLTPYYERRSDVLLTMVMTGLGDTSQDNLIHVRVSQAGVELEAIFLEDFSTRDIMDFGPAYWEAVATGEIELNP